MRRYLNLCLLPILLAACAGQNIPATAQQQPASPAPANPSSLFTPIPTFTPPPAPTNTPPASLGTIALDFVSLLCNAQWLNGGQKLTACPSPNTDHSGGFATAVDPVAEGLPAGTPALLTIPAWNGYSSIFLRYPAFTVGPNDRFRATLQCSSSVKCDVQFALEYYDSKGKFISPFLSWNYKSGSAPIQVDVPLSALSGQTVDFTLTLRLFHSINNPQVDNGLWIAPHIFRPLQ